MKEIWKEIEGYNGLYKISNYGNIKSIARKGTKEHLMIQSKNHQGYLQVKLTKNGISKTKKVHRLVAQAFIPNPNNLPQIDHIDDNKENNYASNLQWITNEDNMAKSWKTGARSIEKTYKRGKEHSNAKIINQYDLQGNYIKTWYCINDVERELGFDNRNICACCRHKKKTAYGFKWEYAHIE